MTARSSTKAAKPEVVEAEPLVDLDDIAPDRPTVRFGGKLYEMRVLDDFGIAKQHALNRDGREFYGLWTSDDELSDAQQQRLQMLLERMFDQVLDAPDTVKGELTDGKKTQVVLGFTLAPLVQQQKTAQKKALEEQEQAAGQTEQTQD
jgi:hypothetical protein